MSLEDERDAWKATAEGETKRRKKAESELASRPTMWAYESACAALEKHRDALLEIATGHVSGGSAEETLEVCRDIAHKSLGTTRESVEYV